MNILSNHGLVCFGESPKIAYENMINLVSLAEKFVFAQRPKVLRNNEKHKNSIYGSIAPVVRGAYCRALKKYAKKINRELAPGHEVLGFRTSPQILDYMDGPELERYACLGVPTPDYAIFIKIRPIILSVAESTDDFSQTVDQLFCNYIQQYYSPV